MKKQALPEGFTRLTGYHRKSAVRAFHSTDFPAMSGRLTPNAFGAAPGTSFPTPLQNQIRVNAVVLCYPAYRFAVLQHFPEDLHLFFSGIPFSLPRFLAPRVFGIPPY
jgi:hypothetical protein